MPSSSGRRLALLVVLALSGVCGALGRPATAEDGADDAAERQAWARDVVRRNGERKLDAPDFGAKRPWLNVSRPLTLRSDLVGKVVVLDFWCYCCIVGLNPHGTAGDHPGSQRTPEAETSGHPTPRKRTVPDLDEGYRRKTSARDPRNRPPRAHRRTHIRE